MLLSAVRAALAARLATITGLHAYAEWPESPVLPCVLLKVAAGDHQQTFGGTDRTRLLIEAHLLVTLKGGLVNAEKAIEGYLSNTGASSISAVVRADPYLGASVLYALAGGWKEYDTKEVAGLECLGAIVDVMVDVQ